MRLQKISIFYLVAFFALLSSIGNIWSGEMEPHKKWYLEEITFSEIGASQNKFISLHIK